MSKEKISLDLALKIFGLGSLEKQTEADIKKIYHKLAKEKHPDTGGSTDDFIELREAFAVIKKALNDPYFEKYGKFREEQGKSQQSENSYSSNSSSSYENYNPETVFEEMKMYQSAYKKAAGVVEKYERIFNSQIKVVNQAKSRMNNLHKNYQETKMKIVSEYDIKILDLDKKRGFSLKNIVFGPMSKEEYIHRKNQAVMAHNQEISNLESQFLDSMLEIYETTLNSIIDFLDS